MASTDLFTAYPFEDYQAHRTDIDAALRSMLERGYYILGYDVQAFEGEFAAWTGAQHAVGVANGTDAIEVILRALGIGEGDAVAVPSLTAVASVSAIRRAGAIPVYLDVDLETRTVLPESLEQALESPVGNKIKALLAVHLYGHPCELGRLQEICDRAGVVLLEDCAQAHGAMIGGQMIGSLGRAAAFSFYPTKNLAAIGDGGAVVTSDAALAERMREVRQYGWRERYISAIQGVNSRLDEMQAAILRVKLRVLGERNAARRALAERYTAGLQGVDGITVPTVQEGMTHAWHLYVVRSAQRDALLKHLTEAKIPAAIHYPAAVHQQPGYAEYAAHSPALTNTETLVAEILSLPLHPYLTPEAVDHVVESIRSFQA